MRRLTVGLLAACLAASGAGASTAQSPIPEPEAPGQRAEASEAGIALTFPADWRVEATPWAEDGLLQAGSLWAEGVCLTRMPAEAITSAEEADQFVSRDRGVHLPIETCRRFAWH